MNGKGIGFLKKGLGAANDYIIEAESDSSMMPNATLSK
jgi:hypothetical protein